MASSADRAVFTHACGCTCTCIFDLAFLVSGLQAASFLVQSGKSNLDLLVLWPSRKQRRLFDHHQVCGLQYSCTAWVDAHVPFHKLPKRINQQVDSNMRRSKSKTGTQRRRSSGSLKFGLLSVHETKILPTKNANFSTPEAQMRAQRAAKGIHHRVVLRRFLRIRKNKEC